MNALELKLIAKCAQFRVEKSELGMLTLRFPLIRLLPASAKPHMRYVEDAYRVLPGVLDARLDAADGKLAVTYDSAKVTEQDLLGWWNVVLHESGALAEDSDSTRGKDAQQIAALLMKRLSERI